MNPERMRELLTAAVDGELTPTEQRIVERLLKESESARILHAQLQRDAALLKSLPRIKAPADFAQRVLQEIQERNLTPTPLPPSPRITRPHSAHSPTPWTSIFAASAAVIMVVVSSALLYYVASSDNQPIAKTKPKEDHTDHPSRSIPSNTVVVEKRPTRLDILPREVAPQVVAAVPKSVSEKGPEPRLVEDRFLFNQPQELPEIQAFQLDKIRVSRFYALVELAEKETQARLIDDLKKDELLRLDLFCNSTAKGLEIIQGAFKARKVTLGVDAHATDRLTRKLSTELVLYTESLTPEEVAGLLTAIGVAESKKSASEFDTLVVAPFLATDLTQLGRLLGASAVMPKISPIKGVDIRKPLPEGTAQQVASSLSKMGTNKSAPKVEKPAIIVSYSPLNPAPNNSKEIKTFLEQRGERKPNTKPLMLVLRTR